MNWKSRNISTRKQSVYHFLKSRQPKDRKFHLCIDDYYTFSLHDESDIDDLAISDMENQKGRKSFSLEHLIINDFILIQLHTGKQKKKQKNIGLL